MGGAPRIFEKVRAKVTLTAQGEGGLKAKIFDWAIGVGIKASRIRQQGGSAGFLLKVQLAIADRLVFSKVRDRLGGRIRLFVSGSAALSAEVWEWFDAVGMNHPRGLRPDRDQRRVRRSTCPATPGSARSARRCPDTEVEDRRRRRGDDQGPRGDARVPQQARGHRRGASADGWFHSGDIGELVDGYLKITDRKKDLIKTSGGKYVAPQKIEVIFSAECP